MNDLRQAAQAVIDSWDSPLWNNGSTANAIADLRTALEQQAEPVGEVIDERGEVDYISYVPPVGTALYTLPQQQAEPMREPFEDLATELFVVAQRSPADNGFSDTIDRIELWLREHFSTQPQRKPLTEAQQVDCLVKSGCIGTVKMSFESGPYDITRPSINASMLIEAVEAAHGIKENT